GKIIYVRGLGWLCWDGRRWMPDSEDLVLEFAKRSARNFYAEAAKAAEAGNEKLAEALSSHAKVSAYSGRVRAAVELARSDQRLRLPVERLDARHDALNVGNGILDLGTLELRDHDPAELLTKVTNG